MLHYWCLVTLLKPQSLMMRLSFAVIVDNYCQTQLQYHIARLQLIETLLLSAQ